MELMPGAPWPAHVKYIAQLLSALFSVDELLTQPVFLVNIYVFYHLFA